MPMPESRPVALPSTTIMTMAPTATRVEPTDRSMPPEMMTKVMPRAMMPTGALLRRMLSQLVSRESSSSPTLPSPKL